MTGLFRKIGQALLASLLFLVVLALVYLARAFFTVDVVFYAALLDVVLALLISAGVLVLARALSVFEKVQMLLIWALAGYALAISVPTVIDRSLSFTFWKNWLNVAAPSARIGSPRCSPRNICASIAWSMSV